MEKTIIEILRFWNINDEIHQVYSSAWSIGNKYILKAYDNQGNLEKNITIMRTLTEADVPAARPVQTLDGLDYINTNDKYYVLFNKLQGTHVTDIYNDDYTKVAFESGKILARLHNAFLWCEKRLTFEDNSLLDEFKGWIHQVLKENNYRHLGGAAFNSSLTELTECYDKLPRQLIHRDFHFGNILFCNGELSGYIDFDLSERNVRIFDMCYFLAGLLDGHVESKEDVDKWYAIISNFVKGYENINPISKIEKDSIPCLMKNIELLFVAYFMKTGNDEIAKSTAGLYHFIKDNEKNICAAVYNSTL